MRYSFPLFPFDPPIDVVGPLQSIQFFFTLLQVRHEIPLAYLLIYGLGNLMLQGLNWFWWGLFKSYVSFSFFLMKDGVGFTK